MELLHGRDLAEELGKHGPLSPRRSLHILLQCARALVNLAEFARWVRTLGTYRASSAPSTVPSATRDAVTGAS